MGGGEGDEDSLLDGRGASLCLPLSLHHATRVSESVHSRVPSQLLSHDCLLQGPPVIASGAAGGVVELVCTTLKSNQL